MTTDKFNDETRTLSNDETRIADENTKLTDNEATHTQDENTEIVTDVNAAAPVSRKAAAHSPWASRLGFAAAGAAAGFAAGFAVSANAAGTSTSSDKVTGLAPAATPDDEKSEQELADSVAPARERTTLDDDVNDRPASIGATTQRDDIEIISIDDDQQHTSTITNHTEQDSIAANATAHAAHAAQASETIQATSSATVQSSVTPMDNEAVEVVEVHVEDGQAPAPSEIILANANGIHYAHVDDNMSFGEAFATARAQVGTPGVFTWHGNTYGTYYAEEWNDMSMAERTEFIHAVDYPEDLNRDADVADVIPEPEYNPDYDLNIQIVEITQTMDAEGDISTTAHMTVNDTDVYMTDLDGDGTMDVAIVDIDGDGEFTVGTDAMLPTGDMNLTVDNFVDAIQDQNIDNLLDNVSDDLAQADFDPTSNPDF